MNEAKIVELARSQHGLITTQQARDGGATRQQIWQRVNSGAWMRVRRGVLAVGAAPTSWEMEVMAACLAAGDGVAASHRSAGRALKLVTRSGQIEVLAPEGRQVALTGVATHRSYLFPDSDRTSIDGIPVTSAARTIVDLAPGHAERVVGGWVDDAVRRQLTTLSELRDCVGRLACPGRPRISGLHAALLRRISGYEPGDSELEARIIRLLVEAGLPLPAQQVRVQRPDGSLAFIDLAYPEHRIAIEVDGWSAHGHRGAFDRDRMRANDLTLLGWRVLRFTSATPEATIVRTVRIALGLSRAA
jgi:very-short-patch-repair endonuclease